MRKKVQYLLENSGLFFGLLALLLFLFTVFASFNGLYGQDAHEYFRYTKSMHDFFVSGKNPGDYFWPLLYPVCGGLLSLFIPTLLSLQLISSISFVVTFYFLEKIIAILFDTEKRSIRIYLLLFLFLSPFMLRASAVVMSDMFCTMWITISFYAFIKFYSLYKQKYFLLFVVSATAAAMTRYVSSVLIFLPAIVIGIRFLKQFSIKYFCLAILSVLVLTAPHFLIRQTNPAAFLHHDWLQNWSLQNFFRVSFDTLDGHAEYSFPNILYAFLNWIHPGYIFTGVFFIFFFRKKIVQSLIQKILLGSVFLYSFFIAGIPLQNLRFEQLSFPLVLILFFPSAIAGLGFISTRMKKERWIVSIAIIQLLLFVRAFIPFYNYNHLERQVAEEVKKYPGSKVYTFEMESALQSYDVKNKIVGLWNQKLDSVESHSLLLFNEKKFESQWKGTNVMLNYEMMRQNKKIKLLKSFDNGWHLNELE